MDAGIFFSLTHFRELRGLPPNRAGQYCSVLVRRTNSYNIFSIFLTSDSTIPG
jgi:hypothetical protein